MSTLLVTDRCAEVMDHGHPAPARDSAPTCILIHRIGSTLDRWPHGIGSTVDVAAAFAAHPELRGIGRLPYHLLVWPGWAHGSGRAVIEQGIPLHRRGCGALGWSRRAVEVALVCGADQFRTEPPEPEQWRLTCELVSALWRCLPEITAVLGHTEAHHIGPPATSDPAKMQPEHSCPGRRVEALLPELRASLGRVADCDGTVGTALAGYGLRW